MSLMQPSTGCGANGLDHRPFQQAKSFGEKALLRVTSSNKNNDGEAKHHHPSQAQQSGQLKLVVSL